MILGQTIIPIYLPMPNMGDMPTEDVNTLLVVGVGIACLIIGFAIGLWINELFK